MNAESVNGKPGLIIPTGTRVIMRVAVNNHPTASVGVITASPADNTLIPNPAGRWFKYQFAAGGVCHLKALPAERD